MLDRIAVTSGGDPAVRSVRALDHPRAPATAVVVSREVDRAHRRRPRLREPEALVRALGAVERARFGAQRGTPRSAARREKAGEVAAFPAVRDLERARRVRSVHAIMPAAGLGPRLIADVERWMERVTGGCPQEREDHR